MHPIVETLVAEEGSKGNRGKGGAKHDAFDRFYKAFLLYSKTLRLIPVSNKDHETDTRPSQLI